MCTDAQPQSCLNLEERFGKRYRIEYEESYFADRQRRTVADPWLMLIPCRHGHIFPWSSSELAASTSRSGSVAKRLAAVASTRVVQDGSDGITAAFPPEAFADVARLMRPRLRRTGRRLTPAQKQRLAAMGRQALARHRAEATSGTAPEGLICTAASPAASQVARSTVVIAEPTERDANVEEEEDETQSEERRTPQ